MPAPKKAPPSEPVEPVQEPVKKVAKKVAKKAVKKVKNTAPSTVTDPGWTVEESLAEAEATSRCLDSGISKLDVAALENCVNRLLG